MAKSVPPPAIGRVALALRGPVGQVEARLVLGRQRLDARGARQAQRLVAAAGPRGRRAPRVRHAVSVAPSSSACAAPWAMNGSIGWHASPSRVTRPRDQLRERRAVEQGPDERLVDRAQDLVQLRMPALEGGDRVGRVAGVGPRLARPAVLLDDRHEVDEPPALDVVVHEVGLGAHPDLGGHLEVEVAQALGRHQPAIRGAAGEDGVLRAEQHLADGRVDAVGADQEVDLDRRAVRERRLDAVAVVDEAGEPVADVQALGRERADERAQQVGAVHLVVREAEGVDDGVAEVGAAAASVRRPSGAGARPAGGRPCRASSSASPGDAGRATRWG